jgi:hypothetical protein
VQGVYVHRIALIVNDDRGVFANSDEILMGDAKFPPIGKSKDERSSVFVYSLPKLLDVHAVSLPRTELFVKSARIFGRCSLATHPSVLRKKLYTNSSNPVSMVVEL